MKEMHINVKKQLKRIKNGLIVIVVSLILVCSFLGLAWLLMHTPNIIITWLYVPILIIVIAWIFGIVGEI